MFSERTKEIPFKGIPEVVWIGDSHIRRLKEWYQNDAKHLPIEDRRFLRQSGWACSGGAKFDTYVDRIGGFKLPRRQRHQGDQWTDLIVKHPFPYAYILSMGSNDVSDMYRLLQKWRLQDKKANRKGTDHRWFRFAFRTLTKRAKTHVKFIKLAFPKARPCYIGIIRRPTWPPIVCRLAKWMGDYLQYELGFSIIKVDKRIKRYHFLERDLVHINRMGYYHFYDAVSQATATPYMQSKTTD